MGFVLLLLLEPTPIWFVIPLYEIKKLLNTIYKNNEFTNSNFESTNTKIGVEPIAASNNKIGRRTRKWFLSIEGCINDLVYHVSDYNRSFDNELKLPESSKGAGLD